MLELPPVTRIRSGTSFLTLGYVRERRSRYVLELLAVTVPFLSILENQKGLLNSAHSSRTVQKIGDVEVMLEQTHTGDAS